MRLIAVLAALIVVAAACSSDRATSRRAEAETDTTAADDGGRHPDRQLRHARLAVRRGRRRPGAATRASPTTRSSSATATTPASPPSPGLSHETSDAIEAMIAWCNEQGGINGREIVGNYYDATITNVVNAMTQACGEVFMLVGEAWALDSAQEETRVGCDLPAVPTYSVSPEFANGPLTGPAGARTRPTSTPAGVAGQLAELFPDEVKNVVGDVRQLRRHHRHQGQGRPDVPRVRVRVPRLPAASTTSPGESDWKPFAQRLKDCGAEVVYYSGQPYPNMQNMLDDAAQIDYSADLDRRPNTYLQSFADWNTTGNGDNVYLRSAFYPFEQADDEPGHPAVHRHRRGQRRRHQPARRAVDVGLPAVGHRRQGLRGRAHPPVRARRAGRGHELGRRRAPRRDQPRREPAARVQHAAQARRAPTWVQAYPEEVGEIDCDPDGTVPLTGRVVDQAELDENRISTKYQ